MPLELPPLGKTFNFSWLWRTISSTLGGISPQRRQYFYHPKGVIVTIVAAIAPWATAHMILPRHCYRLSFASINWCVAFIGLNRLLNKFG